MNRTAVIAILKFLGGVIGLLGLGMLWVTGLMMWQGNLNSYMIVFCGVAIAFGAYFVYVAYLAWFRMSARAIRHICGTVAFWILAVVTQPLRPEQSWSMLIWVVCAILGYVAYRSASRRLTRSLFPGDNNVGVRQGTSA